MNNKVHMHAVKPQKIFTHKNYQIHKTDIFKKAVIGLTPPISTTTSRATTSNCCVILENIQVVGNNVEILRRQIT